MIEKLSIIIFLCYTFWEKSLTHKLINECEALVYQITENMKKSKDELNYDITTSIGYSLINDIENVDEAFETADKMLYEKRK